MTFRKVHVCAFALVSILIASGCQPAPKSEEKGVSPAEIARINASRDLWVAAFNAGDAAATAATYSDDGVLMPAHRAAVEGRQAIQDSFQAMFQGNTAKIALMPLETQVAGDWAYDRGTFSITVTPKAGGNAMEDSGKYLVILKRQADGSWKVHRDIDNSNNPLPAPAAKKK